MDYQSIIIGLLSSVTASFIFLLLMLAMRPRIEISALIARTNYDGRKVFVVKIINRCWWKLYDIHAELAHVSFENVTGGQNVYSKPLSLLKNNLWSINSIHGWSADVNAEYAALCVCLDDLDVLWTNDTMIEFRVMARHSLSGFNKVMRRRYYKAQSTIRDGLFKFGKSLEID